MKNAHNPQPTTNNPSRSVVWTFTNKTQLNKKQFTDYIERKVFRTIRKHSLLPKSKTITLKKSPSLNTAVLKEILETKFPVKFTAKPNFSSGNLSQIAEDTFKNVLKGSFTKQPNEKAPLQYLSDKEIELYAKLKNIKGVKRKQNKKVQTLFQKFLGKNQDLELNIIKAAKQIQ
jgi:hypothetical protein